MVRIVKPKMCVRWPFFSVLVLAKNLWYSSVDAGNESMPLIGYINGSNDAISK
jgi:hypothetical protein